MEIHITIKKGKVHIDVEGGEGLACEEATRRLIEALGGQVEEVQQKPEYFLALEGTKLYNVEG